MEKIADSLFTLGDFGLPIFFVVGTTKSALIDASVAYMGPRFKRDLTLLAKSKQVILKKRRGADFLLFTHSHFDHVGCAPYFIRNFPDIQIGASKTFFSVFKRDGARKTIEMLNRKLVHAFEPESPIMAEDFDYSPLANGVTLSDGEIINLGGGITIEVVATPGHTRDSISFYLPYLQAIITGEAIGILPGDGSYVSPEFLSSYDDYIASIHKVWAKKPALIVPGHHARIEKNRIEAFFEFALKNAEELKRKIERYLAEEAMDEEKVVSRIKDEEYLTLRLGKQPEEAYLKNLRAQVGLIRQTMEKTGG